MLRSLRTMEVICPDSLNSITGSGRSKSIEPRRARLRVQDHGEIAHGDEFFGEVRVLRVRAGIVLQHGVYRRVSHSLGGANDAAREIRRDDFAIGVEFHDRAHHQAVFARIERADSVREFLGQHGLGAIRKINGSPAQTRFAVERRAAPDVVRNVGDVNLQLPVSVFLALHIHRVVEIPRRFSVNRDDGQIAEVAPPRAFRFAHRTRRGGRLRQDFRGKFVREMMFSDEDFHVHAKIARLAENFDHAARRAPRRRAENASIPR